MQRCEQQGRIFHMLLCKPAAGGPLCLQLVQQPTAATCPAAHLPGCQLPCLASILNCFLERGQLVGHRVDVSMQVLLIGCATRSAARAAPWVRLLALLPCRQVAGKKLAIAASDASCWGLSIRHGAFGLAS